MNGVSQKPENEWPPSLEHVAYHEAGHAVLQHVYGLTASIRIEADALEGGKAWGAEHVAKPYCDSIIKGEPPTGPAPTEAELGEALAILLAGEAAYHIWYESSEDTENVVRRWRQAQHDDLVNSDRRYREVYLACKVATHFFNDDTERACDFVVARQQAASKALQKSWYGVKALAAGVLANYWTSARNRAFQNREVRDYGLLTEEDVADFLKRALHEQ